MIAFDGPDHTGKTTQAQMLVNYLSTSGRSCKLVRFPGRTTQIGQLLGEYLKSTHDVPPRAVSMLFAANRHEFAPAIVDMLNRGTHVVLDRSSFSGIAYAMSLGLEKDYCETLEAGLPCPDAVFNLSTPPPSAMETRHDWGSERYDTTEAQDRVRRAFRTLFASHSEVVVNVAWGTVDEVAATVAAGVEWKLGELGDRGVSYFAE